MIDAHVEREVVLALDDPEPEAIPLQRIRGGQDVVCAIPPASSHRARSGRTRCRAGSAMVCRTMWSASVVLEPAAVRVVPAKVRVDDVGHGTDVAPTGDVPGGDEQPRDIEPLGRLFAIATKCAGLHVAGRHGAHRRLLGLLERRRRRVPRHDRTRPGSQSSIVPIVHCALRDNLLSSAQQLRLTGHRRITSC